MSARSLPAETFWGRRWQQARDVTVPVLLDRLEAHGAIDNFRDLDTPRQGWWFADSDVHKWLEAACWAGRLDLAEPVADVVLGAQAPDGYLNSYWGAQRYAHLDGSHELYCMGHFVEAALAHHTVTGSDRLLAAAVRVGDHLCEAFGPGGPHAGATDGHPEIELALAGLAVATGERRYAEQARRFVAAAGPGALAFPAGHAVRDLYLATGAWDAAVVLGDESLAGTVRAWWDRLVAEHLYVTGGVGGRWLGEAVGRPHELPNEMAYAETCAAVATARLARRLGDDATERRVVHNALLAGVDRAGTAWFYSSPLAASLAPEANAWASPADFAAQSLLERFPPQRRGWYDVTCCPTNLTRWLAALPWWSGAADDPVAEALAAAPRVVAGHPRREATRGCVAVEVGPFVLCAERVAGDGPDPVAAELVAVGDVVPGALDGLPGVAAQLVPLGWEGPPYAGREVRGSPAGVVLVPFAAWANRGPAEMAVWFRDGLPAVTGTEPQAAFRS